MSRSARGTAIGVALILFGAFSLFMAGRASAHPDVRPCVSMREFHGLHLNPAITLAEVEAKWEQKGDDVTTGYANNEKGYGIFQFKACGFSRAEVFLVLITQPLSHIPSGDYEDGKIITGERLRFVDSNTVNGHN